MLPALLFVSLVWLVSVCALGALGEWHHFYIGLVLFALGLHWLGLLVVADDAVQHTVQLHAPSYRSPLHRLYARAYPYLPAWLQL